MQPRARTRVAYDTDTSASCEGKQSRCDRRCIYRWQDDVLAAVDGAWHIAPLPTSGMRRPRTRWNRDPRGEENAQTEAQDVRCLDASELKQWSHRGEDPSDEKKKTASRRSPPLMLLRDFCVSTIGRETTSNDPKEKNHTALPWSREHVHPCCCLCFRQANHNSFSSFTPPMLSPARSKITKFAPPAMSPSH